MSHYARTILAGLLALVFAASAQAAPVGGPSAGGPACRAWNHGAAARRHGWRLVVLQGAQRWAMLSFYNERVAPRANAKSDKVIVAFHPQAPFIRVVILHGNCIVDIGQMSADALEAILSNDGTPV
jgi:hypothetical protein